jgi:hypothetical protein
MPGAAFGASVSAAIAWLEGNNDPKIMVANARTVAMKIEWRRFWSPERL